MALYGGTILFLQWDYEGKPISYLTQWLVVFKNLVHIYCFVVTFILVTVSLGTAYCILWMLQIPTHVTWMKLNPPLLCPMWVESGFDPTGQGNTSHRLVYIGQWLVQICTRWPRASLGDFFQAGVEAQCLLWFSHSEPGMARRSLSSKKSYSWEWSKHGRKQSQDLDLPRNHCSFSFSSSVAWC